MSTYVISGERLTELANVIRQKAGLTTPLSLANMVSAVHDIVSEGDIDAIIKREATEVSSRTADKIGSNAFYNYTTLENASFPLVRIIGNDAFNGCTSLSVVELPSLSILGARVFNGCSSLTGIDLRDSRLAAIPANTFYGSDLCTIWLPSSVFCAAVSNSFNGCPLGAGGSGGTIYIPSKYRTTYESNIGWADIISSTNNRIISY